MKKTKTKTKTKPITKNKTKKISIEDYNKKMSIIINKNEGMAVPDILISLLEEASKWEIK